MFRRILQRIRTIPYNEYTIENYFAKKGCLIGYGNRIFIDDLGSEPYLISIGNHCTITEGVKFITHDGGFWVFKNKSHKDLHGFGKIQIKDNCFIGINSVILPNVTIGPNSVVGAGSVVTKDVPKNTVVAGVPAKAICSIDQYIKRSYEKYGSLRLKGNPKMWKRQLQKYFWDRQNSF